MKQSEIKIGETYLFVATDSVTRKHLEGKPFEVVRKEKVWRKLKKRRAYVYRFFNEQGDGARAEELEPLFEMSNESKPKTGNMPEEEKRKIDAASKNLLLGKRDAAAKELQSMRWASSELIKPDLNQKP